MTAPPAPARRTPSPGPGGALLLTALFRGRGPLAVFGLIIAVVFAVNVNLLVIGAHDNRIRSQTTEQQILASYDLANDGAYVFPGAPTVIYAGPAPTVAGLRQIRRSGWLGPPDYPVFPRFRLGAQAGSRSACCRPGRPRPPPCPP